MKQIPLTRGRVAVVDDEDYEMVAVYNWQVTNGYASRDENSRTVYMHREIMRPAPGRQVDHANHDRLDNRRANLRVCTVSENQGNQLARRRTSRFKGVSFCRAHRRWRAHITAGGRHQALGSFSSEEAAALAYDKAARQHFGEFAYLNFPERTQA